MEVMETPQQYTGRILGNLEGKQPLEVLVATASKLEHLIKGSSAAELQKRPAPEKWSVNEIVAHLADGEIVVGFRVRLILGSPGAPIVACDQDQWSLADITKSAIRRTLSSCFVSCGKQISCCFNRSSPSSGSSSECTPNEDANRSSTSCA